MTKVLHIIQSLSLGGAARAMLGTAKYSQQLGGYEHRVASLLPAEPAALELALDADVKVLDAPSREVLRAEMESADIVQVEWWNNAETYDLLRSDLPPMRLLVWFHVAGDSLPHVITDDLVDYADMALACSPYTHERPAFQRLSPETRLAKTGMVYGAADFDRLRGLSARPHSGFNVGYIGTVNFVKLHPRYVAMSAAVDLPDIRFVVCGGGIEGFLQQQATELGKADRFDFRGYVEDIRPVLAQLDVYGYPLCEDTFAAAELNLQEVMAAGIPPVVFPHGGIRHLVINDFTGLVVHSELEYKHAIEYLYHHPEERARLGRNARDYAHQIFGAENAARRLNPLYAGMLERPKRGREWGMPEGVSLLSQPVDWFDLNGDGPPSGARIFAESLGEAGKPFLTSLTSEDACGILEAEEVIATSPSSLASGGILHYRNHFPQDGYLRLWSGLVLLAQGRVEAAGEFEAAQLLLGSHWRLAWYLARAQEKAGLQGPALLALEEVVRRVPGYVPAVNQWCDHLMAQDRAGEALETLERTLSIRPAALEAWKRLAIARFTLGDTEAARAAFEQVLALVPDDTDALFSLADMSLSDQRPDEALVYFERVVAAAPADAEAHIGLALAARRMQQEALCEQALRKARQLAPDHPGLEELGVAHA